MSASWSTKTYRTGITKIIFKKVNKGSSLIENGAVESWEIQQENIGSAIIMANITENEDIMDDEGNTGKTLTIISDQTIYANPNSYRYFAQMPNLKSIDFTNFDTSKTIVMHSMFQDSKKIEYLNLKNFNTENVENMSQMFRTCSNLKGIDFGNIVTYNVTSMYYMFDGCTSLSDLNLTNFNTNKVKDMECMFRECTGLETLDLSSFNTISVTTMKSMFRYSNKLKTIYVTPFDKENNKGWSTNNVENSDKMFEGCNKLVGELGTVYNSKMVDMTYAHIDTKESPGYFTKNS